MSALHVILAEHAGACYGVQRALDMTLKAREMGDSVCTLGPLIHNPQVVHELDVQGIHAVSSVDEVTAHSVVIRSHGVVPEVIDEILSHDLNVVDATCPHVMRAQKAAASLAQQGFHVVVVGEAGHPEVEGISAHARNAGADCSIVGSVDEIPDTITAEVSVGVVVQTTQSEQKLNEIVDALQERGCCVTVKNTICSATTQRQKSAVELAKQVDAMLIIGGRNSSNTTRLYEICKFHCLRSYHIERVEEIDPQWFSDCRVVGVTAGASTPDNQIEPVIAWLDQI